ncbi:flagellar M-ring protein FliF [Natronocella acetinitrilica]|uniref:Flagellar M-ring protein n=1 Tax=Natronocella acetinitrilica TaxID=414046 RepID=A0AAE3KBI6_9GAMM|nr:flagellar basal-body MS-ring/collar protein FliF [Natronocella acetinitrilica]MCP1675605.1 flagellar M-ring protein FliF [Natronocella acetinitrilica]
MADAQALTTTDQGMLRGDSRAGGKRPWDGLMNGAATRQIGLIAGLAIAMAMVVGIFFWAQQPVYRTVFGSLPESDRAAVVEALQASDREYRLDRNTGAIQVPATQVHETRLYLAGQGLPKGQGVGYEMLQEDQRFGTSQFMETARFQRALETELARSIGSLSAVEQARVHLAMPRETVFIRETSQPSASVVVTLAAGRRLNENQVAAIVHLVASSVPEMSEERVTVVDQRGDLLTQDSMGDAMGLSARQFEYQQWVERSYAQRIEDLLTPMVGAGRVRARVNTLIDFDHEEITQETFDPDTTVIRSEQTSEERREAGGRAEGVPGALTNQPPGAGQIGGEDAFMAESIFPFNTSNQATRNFEVGRTVRHNRRAQGGIERLTVAVLVDQPMVAGDDGEMVREAMSDVQIQRLTALIQDAIGFDGTRGDSINVIDAAFQEPEAEVIPEPALWEQPLALELGRWMIAAIVALALIFMVIRPMVNGLLGRGASKQPQGEQQAGLPAAESGVDTRRLTGPDMESGTIEQTAAINNADHKAKIDAARQIIDQEPALAANLIKNWLNDDDGK